MSDIDRGRVESEVCGAIVDVTALPLDELLTSDHSALGEAVRAVLDGIDEVHDITAGWSSRLP